MIIARHRLNHWISQAGAILLAIVLLIWTLTPLYNMVLVGVQEKEDVFATNIWPPAPTLDGFTAVIHETY